MAILGLLFCRREQTGGGGALCCQAGLLRFGVDELSDKPCTEETDEEMAGPCLEPPTVFVRSGEASVP